MRNELSDLPMNRSRTLPWKALGPGPQEPPFEFCLSSVFQGLLAFLPIARIWFDLVQLKPDNKTPQYEAYLLSWILLPLLGILLTRFLGRFRPGGIPPHIYLRTSVFLNFILLLAAYWDIQRPDPAPVLFWAALYLLTQAAAWTWASGWGRSPYWRRPSFSAWIYPAMAVLFLGWLTRIDPAWEGRLRPWHLANWLFAAALAYAFLVDLDPRSVRARWGTSSRAWGLVLTVLLTAFFAFLFVDPTGSDCPYNQGYYLGPLADFVNGKTLLVDINSQYGVLLFFFLRLFFPAALPLGFHSFFFFDALLRLCQYVVFFWIARKLFKSILYPALGTVVLILLNCGLGPTSALWYPSQGALRFGFIFLLAALVVLRNRHPRWAAWFLGLESATAAV
ncbi:MAG TPA: hypothetical protein VFR02_10670, partial [bacterium]|nr:hypothetical protein [bacterium]